jgi:hypothetical protein
MNYKFLTLLAAVVLVFTGSVFAQKAAPSETQKAVKLAGMLPASDGVMTLDSKRLFGEALPQMLVANPGLLTEINGHAENLKQRTGIDIREFDRVAVGTTIKETKPGVAALDPVVLAQGKYTPDSLLVAVKFASGGDYRQEKIGEKTIYVFTLKKPLSTDAAPKTSNSYIGKMIDMILKGLSNEVAVGPLDSNTVAFGSAARVRQTFAAGSRAGLSVLGLPGLQHGGLMAFGARIETGLSTFLPLDDDELGKSIDSIKFLSGWMDLASGNTVLQVKAKTALPEQAQELHETLQNLQSIGKALIGGSKGSSKAVYSRMIDNAKFSRVATEITLDLQVPQADINVLLGEKK